MVPSLSISPLPPITVAKSPIYEGAPSYIGDFATVIGGNGEILREGTNGWICQQGNPRPYPKDGWKSAHEAMPACHDEEGMKWMMAYAEGKAPNLSRDTYMWMLHGDVGEDNLVPGVLNESDSTPGQWIESGPHLMLMPKDPDSLKNFTTDFTKGELSLCKISSEIFQAIWIFWHQHQMRTRFNPLPGS